MPGITDPCAAAGWTCDTDSRFGTATTEWEVSPTPDDLTTPLGADEAYADGTDAVFKTDPVTQCLTEAFLRAWSAAMEAIGSTGEYVNIRIRHIHIRKIRLRKRPTASTTGP